MKSAWRVGGGSSTCGSRKRVFEREGASAGNHGDDSLGCAAGESRYRSQSSGTRSNFASGIWMIASIWRHSAMSVSSAGRTISERAPKPDPLEPVEPAFDHEAVAQLGRAAVIDLGPDDDRILLVSGHLREAEPELLRREGSARLR